MGHSAAAKRAGCNPARKKRASEEQPQEIDIKAEMKRHAPEQFPIIQVAACWYAEKCMYYININIEI
jgi:hypothetical protein